MLSKLTRFMEFEIAEEVITKAFATDRKLVFKMEKKPGITELSIR